MGENVMPSTAVEITNMALSRCGASPITAFDDANDKGRLALEYYEPTVLAMLRRHPWNFAIRRMTLAASSTAPLNEWEYQYPLPSDPYCVRALQINDGQDDYLIEGRNILTNESAVILRYVARVDESEFDPAFVNALVLTLASKFMYRLTVSDASRGAILQELQTDALPEARTSDSMEQREPYVDPATESTWVAARHSQMT